MNLFELTVPQLAKTLRNLDRWLKAGRAVCREPQVSRRQLDPRAPRARISSRSSARSSPRATTRSSSPGRLAGRRTGPRTPIPRRRSSSSTRGSRRSSTYLEGFKPDDFAGAEDRKISLPWMQGKWITGGEYVDAVRAAELLLSRHAQLRDPAPQRRAARQDRLHRSDPDARVTTRRRSAPMKPYG